MTVSGGGAITWKISRTSTSQDSAGQMMLLGSMQTHYLAEKGITFDRSIHGFSYFARKSPRTVVDAFQCDIRGPKFPWKC